MDGEENTKLEQGVINRQRRGHDMVQAWALIAASHGMHVLTGNKFCHGHSMQFDLANIMCLRCSCPGHVPDECPAETDLTGESPAST